MLARVRTVRWEADQILGFRLEPLKAERFPAFTAGAHVGVALRPGLKRSYSLLNNPAEQDAYEIGVQLDRQSRGGSRHIHEHWRAGHVVELSEPRNLFPLKEDARHSILIAGGIGVTPLLSMMARLEDLGRSWEMYYAVRSRNRAAFLERLEGRPNVHVTIDDEPATPRLDLKALIAKGFDGHIRELADRIGVTNGLLFRYFPTKAALLDRVYSEVFEARWSPTWEEALSEKNTPLRERLVTFYMGYASIVHSPQWVRTFLYAGLAGLDINRKYLQLLRKTIFPRVLGELRSYHGVDVPPREFSPMENELIASLHAMVFHAGVRRWVYGYEVLPAAEGIPLYVDMFLAGARSIYANAKAAPRKRHR